MCAGADLPVVRHSNVTREGRIGQSPGGGPAGGSGMVPGAGAGGAAAVGAHVAGGADGAAGTGDGTPLHRTGYGRSRWPVAENRPH